MRWLARVRAISSFGRAAQCCHRVRILCNTVMMLSPFSLNRIDKDDMWLFFLMHEFTSLISNQLDDLNHLQLRISCHYRSGCPKRRWSRDPERRKLNNPDSEWQWFEITTHALDGVAKSWDTKAIYQNNLYPLEPVLVWAYKITRPSIIIGIAGITWIF